MLSRREYARQMANPHRSEAAKRGAETRRRRLKERQAWRAAYRREHGREPTPEQVAEFKAGQK